jgi:hypothetical protein
MSIEVDMGNRSRIAIQPIYPKRSDNRLSAYLNPKRKGKTNVTRAAQMR